MDISMFVLEYAASGERGLLDMAMRGYEVAILTYPELATEPVDLFLEALGDSLMQLYDSLGDGVVLEATLIIYRAILTHRPKGHRRRLISLLDLGVALQRSCAELTSDASLLNQAIGLLRDAVELSPTGGPAHRRALGSLSKALFSLYKQSNGVQVLVEGIDISRVILSLPVLPFEHPARFTTMNRLSVSLVLCFKHQGDANKLAEAVDLGRRALELWPLEHRDRPAVLNNLASALHHQFMRLDDMDAFVEAVYLYHQALDLCPPGHSHRFRSLNLLGDALRSGFDQLGNLDSLAGAVHLYRQALDLLPLNHPHRLRSLNSLASVLNAQFEQFGDLDALAEVVHLHRRALDLCPPGHPDRSGSLSKLADALFVMFQRLGNVDVLAEAVDLRRQTRDLPPSEDPNHAMTPNILAAALDVRSQRPVDSDPVNELRQACSLSPMLLQALNVSQIGQDFASSVSRGILNLVMTSYETALASRAAGDLGYSVIADEPVDVVLESLGDSFAQDFDSPVNLEVAILLYKEVLRLRPQGHERYAVSLIDLAVSLRRSFEKGCGDMARLDLAIPLLRRAVELCSSGNDTHLRALSDLATTLHTRQMQLGDSDSLTEMIGLYRLALDLYPLGHPGRSTSLNNLAIALTTKFEQLGDLNTLTEAIFLHRQSLHLGSVGHPDRSVLLSNLAATLIIQFEKSGDMGSLEEAIDLRRQDLDLHPLGHPKRSAPLESLAAALLTRFEQLADLNTLAEMIVLHREVLGLRPLGHSERSTSLNYLANALMIQFERLGDLDTLAEIVDLNRQALDLRPLGHSERSTSLSNLANALTNQFEQLGDSNALAEAVYLHRQALDLRPPGNPDRPSSLNNLAVALMRRFEHLGDLDSFPEVVALHRLALDLHPLGHLHRSASLNNLAVALKNQFEQFGNLNSLAEAVELHRQALDLCPLGHASRSTSLLNLASALMERFHEHGDLSTLAEAVDLYHQALDLCPLGHANRPASLNNLAIALVTRFTSVGDRNALAKAFDLQRQAHDLLPLGHPDHSAPLISMAEILMTLFRQRDDLDAATMAVHLFRVVLDEYPLGHPGRPRYLYNLATALMQRFEHIGDIDSLAEAVVLYRQALDQCLPGHLDRSRILVNVARCMLQEATHLFDFTNGIQHISEALQDSTASARTRLHRVISVLRRVEAAYLSIPGYTRHAYDEMVLQIYILTIGLLPRVASFEHDHTGRLRELSGSETVSRNAATRAIIMKREQEAVEMLEEGRGIFWAQALRLRGTELDLLPPEDAQELKELFQILGAGSVRDDALTSAQQEHQAEKRRLHSEVAEAIVANIRSRPGMERFLMPPAFTTLVQSLPDGFVVILNISELGQHALIMDGCARSVSCISLKLPTRMSGLKRKAANHTLSRDNTSSEFEVSDGELSATDATEDGPRATDLGPSGPPIHTFEDSLADLWKFIVKPVIDVLQLKRSQRRDRPRAWWCATGKLTFLPIHAAGTFDQAARQRSTTRDEFASDYIVSSYTPSILSLVRARSASATTLPRNKVKGLAVHEGNPQRGPGGPSRLHKVKDEVHRVRERFEAAEATITVVNDTTDHPTVPGVLGCLQDPNMNVLHLSCHGEQKEDPLASAFLLHDGDLTIRDLMKLDLKHALLTFLSACQTAKGSQDQPDQAVHLAASMLFCGFKSVVATMWRMADVDGPTVASAVYETLFKEETFDLNDVPYALDDAVQILREQRVEAQRWAVFVHMGA